MDNSTSLKPVAGIVLGDPAGIGQEITLKLLLRPHIYSLCRPLLIGNSEMLFRLADRLTPELFFTPFEADSSTSNDDMLAPGAIPVLDVPGDAEAVEPGKVSAEGGRVAYASLVAGYRLLDKGLIDGLIMTPVNKEALSKSGCGFHSEYDVFADLAGVEEVQSVVRGGKIFRSSVTGHVPFREIIERLTVERIVKTGIGLDRVMRMTSDDPPRLCVSALNPHAGEGGLLGGEEEEIILPAIEELRRRGVDAAGPFPSDTIFNRALKGEFNGIVHLYHDQGNIAMKTRMFDSTAIIYTNLPRPVLSTGHGSAMDIAPLGIANPTNLSYVVDTLAEIWRHSGTAPRPIPRGEGGCP